MTTALAERMAVDLPGAGPLTPLLADPAVSDVLVNGRQVWLDRGAGLVTVEPQPDALLDQAE